MKEVGHVKKKDLNNGIELKPNTCVIIDDMDAVLCSDGKNTMIKSLDKYRKEGE